MGLFEDPAPPRPHRFSKPSRSFFFHPSIYNMSPFLESFISILVAVLLDALLGEPQKWHPLAGFGRMASWFEKHFLCNVHSAIRQKLSGFLALFLLLVTLLTPFYFLQQTGWLNLLLAPLILYFCIAANSLKRHAEAVYQALDKDGLEQARQEVSMIVSRNCEKMQPVEVRRATIESVLENGADAVFAPLFWFMLGGCAGVVGYRLVNTLDAMWGYKNDRYLNFGWAAARLDDVLNFIPARLTALSYALSGRVGQAWHCWRTQSGLLESPNGGVVMTAGAGALNLKLGGPAHYHGQLKQKPFFGGTQSPEDGDIHRANRLLDSSLRLWLLFSGLFGLLSIFF